MISSGKGGDKRTREESPEIGVVIDEKMCSQLSIKFYRLLVTVESRKG
jgi:hypothetical protein